MIDAAMIFARADLRKCVFRYVGAQWQTNVEITGFLLTSVLTRPLFSVIYCEFTYEKRRGRESNPRIAVLQTATLPLGYPAEHLSERKLSGALSRCQSMEIGRWTLSLER